MSEDAKRILDIKYASGEISEDEYLKKINSIRKFGGKKEDSNFEKISEDKLKFLKNVQCRDIRGSLVDVFESRRSSVFFKCARATLELVVKDILIKKNMDYPEDSLLKAINILRGILSESLIEKMHKVRIIGNDSLHDIVKFNKYSKLEKKSRKEDFYGIMNFYVFEENKVKLFCRKNSNSREVEIILDIENIDIQRCLVDAFECEKINDLIKNCRRFVKLVLEKICKGSGRSYDDIEEVLDMLVGNVEDETLRLIRDLFYVNSRKSDKFIRGLLLEFGEWYAIEGFECGIFSLGDESFRPNSYVEDDPNFERYRLSNDIDCKDKKNRDYYYRKFRERRNYPKIRGIVLFSFFLFIILFGRDSISNKVLMLSFLIGISFLVKYLYEKIDYNRLDYFCAKCDRFVDTLGGVKYHIVVVTFLFFVTPCIFYLFSSFFDKRRCKLCGSKKLIAEKSIIDK